MKTHLFVHEDVDDRVDDGAALGEDRWDDAGDRADDSRPTEGGHHGDDAVRHPAEQVANHRGHHHEQDVELSATGRRPPDTTHLTEPNTGDKPSEPPDRTKHRQYTVRTT